MNTLTNKISVIFIFSLIILAWYSSLVVGLSTDEYFHHINGLVRYKFLVSLGEIQKFEFRNNQYYPGLYDTIAFALGQVFLIINKNFYVNNIGFTMHAVNILFSSLSILGLYLFAKKIFNKDIALLTCLLTLLNPFFFGHMGMNSKDVIIFFSLIWFCYFFYKYCVSDKKNLRNLLLASFFMGFGCGVRLTFLVVIFPVVVIGLFYLISKYRSQHIYLIKRILSHSLVAILITSFLIILCWPHMIVEIRNGNFLNFFSDIVKHTINWNQGPKIGLINGEYYEVFNTPKSYFLSIFAYRIPLYFNILILASYTLFISKNYIIFQGIDNFNKKFYSINLIILFPIFLALILSVNIYDNFRLFLFIIPFLSLLASFSLDYFIKHFQKSIKIKSFMVVILILFIFSFYRFVSLTPYQYNYINFTSIFFNDYNSRWENDYWGASYKELIKKIKQNYSKNEIKNFKITNCSGDMTLTYYLRKELGINYIYRGKKEHEATYAVLINRTNLDITVPAIRHLVTDKGVMLLKDMERIVRTPKVKSNCFELYKGKDEVIVERNGIPLSVFRKLDK